MIRCAYTVLKHATWLLTKGLLTKATLVRGCLKTGEAELNCMFVAPGLFADHILLSLFSESPTILEERRLFTPLLRSFLKQSAPRFDICITSLAREYNFIVRPIATYTGQSSVNQKIVTRNGWEGVRENLSRRCRKRIENFEARYGLGCILSEEPSDLSTFYHQMYLPNSAARFGKLAVTNEFSQMQEFLKRGGFLLFITRNGEKIAGGLCSVGKNRLTGYRCGVLNGDEKLMECGAMTAIYYYLVDYAVINGLRELDILDSKPFLNDGVYRYKGSWGAVAEPFEDKYVRTIHYICGGRLHEVASFFQACPTIVMSNGSLRAIIGCPDEIGPTDAEVSKLIRSFYTSGIRSAEIVTSVGARIQVQLSD